jgi:hypothetical protein
VERDGSNPTLLHQYDDSFDYDIFGRQTTTGDTLYFQHLGADTPSGRLPSHMDIARFSSDGSATVTEAPYLPSTLWDVSWWRADRAVAVFWGDTPNAHYLGGERLVTLDDQGSVLSEQHVPYLGQASVQPGGEWLAYNTGQHSEDESPTGAHPSTSYLLNLASGRRLQVSESGWGHSVGNWSPDGNWFMHGSGVTRADGRARISLPDGFSIYSLAEAVWNASGTRLAFDAHRGGCDLEPEPPPTCQPRSSSVYIVDLAAGKLAELDLPGTVKQNGEGTMVQYPRWSPDGSTLMVLTYDSEKRANPPLSGTVPAIYLLNVK